MDSKFRVIEVRQDVTRAQGVKDNLHYFLSNDDASLLIEEGFNSVLRCIYTLEKSPEYECYVVNDSTGQYYGVVSMQGEYKIKATYTNVYFVYGDYAMVSNDHGLTKMLISCPTGEVKVKAKKMFWIKPSVIKFQLEDDAPMTELAL